MKRSRWILAGLLALMACSATAIHGITPISPRVGISYWSDRPPVVKTLQPTFRWEPVAESNARYDFVIFESYNSLVAVLGRKVYYRERLQEPEHTVEVSLQPDREYYWSVRMRRGEEVSEWSRFDYWSFKACQHRRTQEFAFFRFRTPSK